jgi:hypothetical protein
MSESPAFTKMKAEGKTFQGAAVPKSFGQWKNLKIVLLALLGAHGGPGRGLVHGPVLRAVLPARQSLQGRRRHGQRADRRCR